MLRCEIPRWNGTTTLTTERSFPASLVFPYFSYFLPFRWVSAIIRRVVRTVNSLEDQINANQEEETEEDQQQDQDQEQLPDNSDSEQGAVGGEHLEPQPVQ